MYEGNMKATKQIHTIEQSKTGLPVPVINGVYLHSIYDPEKEAAGLAKRYHATLDTKKNIIILGLGFGYHVEKICDYLSSKHSSYKVLVIDPCQQLVEDFISQRAYVNPNVEIICETNIENLYANAGYINFLMTKPGIVLHGVSLNLNDDYYKKLLQHKDVPDMRTLANIIKCPEIKQYLGQYPGNFTLEDYYKDLAKKEINSSLNDLDFFMLAFKNIESLTENI